MSFEDFVRSTAADVSPPADLTPALQALWQDRRGAWDKAHVLAQAAGGKKGDWVHAYLHRKGGDLDNAGYWYARAGQPVATGALSAEWEMIVRALLAP